MYFIISNPIFEFIYLCILLWIHYKNISITNSEKIGTFLSFNVFNYYFTLLSFEWLWWRTNCEVYLTLLKVQNSCIPSIFQRCQMGRIGVSVGPIPVPGS